ncbi:MAG: hypothetical protein KatS3mg104_2681 [Phycisphaerae bacterium]|nr:MAG: hypothetical protein KatS3mg104_2681 [Phycisphaerae bacterium]
MNISTQEPFKRLLTRSWMEMPVRPWLAVTGLMLLAALGIGIYNFRTAIEERRLIRSGTPVQAVVVDLGRDTRQMPRDEPVRVTLEYTIPGTQKTIRSERMIHRQTGGLIRLRDQIPIRFDPESPEVWTARTEPPPFLQSMTVPLALIPVVLISGLVTFLHRQRVIRVIRKGSIQKAGVVSIRQPPLAPLSKQLGVTLEQDRTVRSLYWPNRLGQVRVGDVIDVRTDGKRVFAVRAYE